MSEQRSATPARVVVVVMAALALSSSCTYTTSARAPARAELWINDEEVGDATPGGGDVSVPVSYFDPTWFAYLDDDEVPEGSGVLERTRLDPITTSSLCASSTLSVPACSALGVLVANPSACVICLAPLSEVFLMSGLNAVRTTFDGASWATVPVVAGCALVGFAPLLLLPFALRVPEEVLLPFAPGTLPSPSIQPPSPPSQPSEPSSLESDAQPPSSSLSPALPSTLAPALEVAY